jgi:hypothetical protein
MLDEDDWASTPEDADWLNFPAMGAIRLHLVGWTGQRVPDISVPSSVIYLAPGQGPQDPFPDGDSPDNPASYVAPAPGSAGVFTFHSGAGEPSFVEVQNLTCSPNWARITVHLSPPPDGGVDGSAGMDDMMGPCWKQNPVFCE